MLFEPGPAVVYAVSSKVGGDPLGFGALTQQSLLPQYWYLNRLGDASLLATKRCQQRIISGRNAGIKPENRCVSRWETVNRK